MKIGIVLVTYNRKQDLIKALKAYNEQTKLPHYIVVVNNNSTDGTKEVLNTWLTENGSFNKCVINLEKNIGGSGGFYTGLQKSLELDADWIWVADDDAYPNSDALQKIEEYYESLSEFEQEKIAAICGTVINNKEIDVSHRRRLKKNLLTIEEVPVDVSEYQNRSFDIDLFSYVGSVINKKLLDKVGITEKDYFIYYDDTEHSLRLSKVGKIVCLSNVKITHDTALQGREQIDWKKYYGVRNKLISYKKHFNKKYYYYLYYYYKLSALRKNDKVLNELTSASLHDAKNDIQGLHKVYKPGWKYEK